MAREDVEAAFDRVLDDIRKCMPDQTTGDAIISRLQRAYDKPPTDALSTILRRGVGVAKCRELLFMPSVEAGDGITLYPTFISGQYSVADPARAVQLTFLAMLYLHHLRDWTMARAFILAGGLQSLSSLFMEPNLFIRSQAIDSFMQLTAHPSFEWFTEISSLPDQSSTAKRQPDSAAGAGGVLSADPAIRERQLLHSAMLSLSNTSFLQSLLDNWNCNFPGGSFYCLQILGFWLSWARKLYSKGVARKGKGGRVDGGDGSGGQDGNAQTSNAASGGSAAAAPSSAAPLGADDTEEADGVLNLSRKVLDRLKEWADRPAQPAQDSGAESASTGSHTASSAAASSELQQKFSTPEEQKLAQDLYNDFSRFPAADDIDVDDGNIASRRSRAGDAVCATTVASAGGSGGEGARINASAMTISGLTMGVLPSPPVVAQIVQPGSASATAPSGASETAVAPAATPTVANPLVAAEQFKTSGNAHFKASGWDSAISAYSKGVTLVNAAGSEHANSKAQNELLTALYSNRAAAHLRASGYGGEILPSVPYLVATKSSVRRLGASLQPSTASSSVGTAVSAVGTAAGDVAKVKHLFEAISDCNSALQLDKSHAKCLFRKAQALLAMGAVEDGVAVARACLASCSIQIVVAEAGAAGSTKGKVASGSASSHSKSNSASKDLQQKKEAASEMASQVNRFITQALALQSAIGAVGDDDDDDDGGDIRLASAAASAAHASPSPSGASLFTSSASATATSKPSAQTMPVATATADAEGDLEDALLLSLLHRSEFGGQGVAVGDARTEFDHVMEQSATVSASSSRVSSGSGHTSSVGPASGPATVDTSSGSASEGAQSPSIGATDPQHSQPPLVAEPAPAAPAAPPSKQQRSEVSLDGILSGTVRSSSTSSLHSASSASSAPKGKQPAAGGGSMGIAGLNFGFSSGGASGGGSCGRKTAITPSGGPSMKKATATGSGASSSTIPAHLRSLMK